MEFNIKISKEEAERIEAKKLENMRYKDLMFDEAASEASCARYKDKIIEYSVENYKNKIIEYAIEKGCPCCGGNTLTCREENICYLPKRLFPRSVYLAEYVKFYCEDCKAVFESPAYALIRVKDEVVTRWHRSITTFWRDHWKRRMVNVREQEEIIKTIQDARKECDSYHNEQSKEK